ncbi:MAG: recombinase RecT [Eubacterium sp.]|nr:recombinase RecT [Eubacterium sp.]
MSNSKSLTPGKTGRPSFTQIISSKGYQKLINNTLSDPNEARQFVASLTSAVTTNPTLAECDYPSIVASAFLGAALHLSPSPQLGQYYLVPFNDKKSGTKKAQFILGYKGMLQLAMRSGQLKKINAIEIKQGELIKYDPLNEEIHCKLIEDWNERNAAETIGYYAFFELSNGFRKSIYWSKEQMISHADTFSMAFSAEAYRKIQEGKIADKDMWKYSSFWYKNFDDMAKKTMLRQLISKGGCPMSVDMIAGYERDNAVADLNEEDEVFIVPAQEAQENSSGLIEAATQPEAKEVVEAVDLSDFDE